MNKQPQESRTRAATDVAAACRQVVSQHQRLREILSVADSLATRVLAGEAYLGSNLLDAAEDIRREFEDHLACEERVLLPALREAGSRGENQVKRVTNDHCRQRAQLAALGVGGRAGHNVRGVALAMHALADDLRRDMDDEERDISTTVESVGSRSR